MTGSYEHLVAHIREHARELFCAAVTARQWQAVRLYLELAHSDYAALPLLGAGWVVLTPHALPVGALDVSRSWQEGLDAYVHCEGPRPVVLSEGWAAAAHAGFAAASSSFIAGPVQGPCGLPGGSG
jgi:hypothetical protein